MKRITSLILSLAIMLNTAVGISLPVAAENESVKEYIHDGYTVTYKVVSEWTGRRRDWGEIYAQLEIFFADRLN